MKRAGLLLSLLFFMVFLRPLMAYAEPPQQMLEELSVEMLDALEAEREAIHQRPDYLFELVEKTLIEHVDLERMSRWVLGKHWRHASESQQQRFNHEFRTLLVRFYVSALLDEPKQLDELLAHRQGLIVFQPVRMGEEDQKCVARATVNLPEGRSVPVVFQLHRYEGPWRIYDVSVENISLVKLYRDNFGSAIAQKGLDVMLDELEQRNQQLLAEARGVTEVEPSTQPANGAVR